MEYTLIDVTLDEGALPLHVWRPEAPASAAVVLVQEIFGIERYIVDVAERLVAAGYVVAAPDLYWRIERDFIASDGEEGLQEAFNMVGQLDVQRAITDVVASLDIVSAFEGVERAAVMGFCLGGTLAFGAAIEAHPAACVAYYGSGVAELLGRIDEVTCPTLFQYGNDDAYIPAEHIEAVNAAIEGRPGFVLNVENAGHAFDNHTREMFYNAEAAQVAWSKTLAFLGEHLQHASQPA